MDWIQRMNLVLDYIENNLDGEIEENKIAELSASPKGMFQRIFAALTDISLSEYIRKRRLTRAASDIQDTNEKIIDIAVKYGYSSADAFGLAFKSFHGAAPSDARKTNIQLQSFYPLNFKFMLSVKGGYDMEYRIIENAESAHTQVYGAAESIAGNASKSASAILEISEKMNAMSSIVVNNYKNAQLASQIALEAAEMANKSSGTAEITDRMNQIQKLAEEIASAKNDQAKYIKQINIAISNMEQDVQSNAVTAEELAESAQELKELIGELDKSSH
jgi:AraC family transcriptional regulator